MAGSSQDTERIEFAWRKLEHGSWLVKPAIAMFHYSDHQPYVANRVLGSCKDLISLRVGKLHPNPRYLVDSLYAFPSPQEHFVFETKDMTMVTEDQGWRCKDLETLHLCYYSKDGSIGIPEVLWRQIAELSKLRDLKLHRYHTLPVLPGQEKETVMQALSSWRALSRLRRLELTGLNEFVDEALFNMVTSQWAQVKCVLTAPARIV
ncbi:unnamed protein product [Mortierella alpina]